MLILLRFIHIYIICDDGQGGVSDEKVYPDDDMRR